MIPKPPVETESAAWRINGSTVRKRLSTPSQISVSCQVKTLPKASTIELEARLIEAWEGLQPAPDAADVSRVATLVRLGSFEVRLMRPPGASSTTEAPFWMELFDHDRQLSIDSVGNCVLAKAVIAAEDFFARAAKLSESPHSWRRSS
jgi:hypothetical protein